MGVRTSIQMVEDHVIDAYIAMEDPGEVASLPVLELEKGRPYLNLILTGVFEGGEMPLAFLREDGAEQIDEDGQALIWVWRSAAMVEIAAAVTAIDYDARFDAVAADPAHAKILGEAPDQIASFKTDLAPVFADLKAFVADAADRGVGIMLMEI